MEYKVTKLSVQKKNPQRVNVFLDDKFAFGVSRFVGAWLSVGQMLDDEKIEQLKSEDQYESGYQAALRLISYRPRSNAEITEYLNKRGYPAETIEAVLQRLIDLELVNDHQFVQQWVDNRNEFRPRGRRALQVELRQRGIEQQIIDEYLANLDEPTLAYQAAVKQAKKLKHLDRQTFRIKMSNFLARRGFSYELISQVVAEVWAEIEQGQTQDTNDYEEVEK